MIRATLTTPEPSKALPRLPEWMAAQSAETPEISNFIAGASFAMLDLILKRGHESMPEQLLGNTLAMKASVSLSKIEGRMANEADIRDAYHLTQPDEDGRYHWGPDGDLLAFWRSVASLRLRGQKWSEKLERLLDSDAEFSALALSDLTASHMTTSLEEGLEEAYRIGPVAAAVQVLQKILEQDDRAERIACLASDIILAKFFGWERPLPITALHLTKAKLRDLKGKAEGAEGAVLNSLVRGAQTTHALAQTLQMRSEALHAVASKLRAKGSADALNLFLAEDAVAPSAMLSPRIRGTSTKMTGRAARRFCDRLVELGVVKELTGRSTFRLYGVGA